MNLRRALFSSPAPPSLLRGRGCSSLTLTPPFKYLTSGNSNKEREPSSKAQMVKECYIPTLRTENNLLTCDFLPCSPVGAGAPLSGSYRYQGKANRRQLCSDTCDLILLVYSRLRRNCATSQWLKTTRRKRMTRKMTKRRRRRTSRMEGRPAQRPGKGRELSKRKTSQRWRIINSSRGFSNILPSVVTARTLSGKR